MLEKLIQTLKVHSCFVTTDRVQYKLDNEGKTFGI